MSTSTNLTMSDVSEIGKSVLSSCNGFVPDNPAQERETIHNESMADCSLNPPSTGTHSSETTKSSSGKSRGSLISELSLSGVNTQDLGFSLSSLGRTHSFPDLLLSTGDSPLPILLSGDSDKDYSDSNIEVKAKRTKSGRLLRPTNHRSSSSESSCSSMSIRFDRAFHPVRSRANTGLSGLNDAMSMMSMDSRRSLRSDTSWLEAYKSMQSINSDQNPWDAEGSLRTAPWGDDGSVRSLLTDISNDLNALDLAESLLPPLQTDVGLDDSGAFMVRPDP